jgi:hypothetical protein
MDPIFDLNQELNDYVAGTWVAPFWEVLGYEAKITTSPLTYTKESAEMSIHLQVTEGYLSPKAGAPC